MIMTIEEVIAFIAGHTDVIVAVYNAITGGAKKEDIVASIKATMVAASDAQMKGELG
jgi:Tfp pilus assembly ATPase PilU